MTWVSPMDTVAVHMHELHGSFRRAGFGRLMSAALIVQALPIMLSDAVTSEIWETVEIVDVDDVPPPDETEPF